MTALIACMPERSSITVNMNKLDTAQRAQVLRCLVDGNSIRGTVRITGIAKNTIVKLLADIGCACTEFQDRPLPGMGAPHRHLPPRPRPETAGGGGGGAGGKRELQRRPWAAWTGKEAWRGAGRPPGPHGGRFQAILGRREAVCHCG
jgi:hypothetical protein